MSGHLSSAQACQEQMLPGLCSASEPGGQRRGDLVSVPRVSRPWTGALYVITNHCGFLQVPASVCTRDCLEGHHRVVVGSHHCCFECMPCEAGTFLNKSGEQTVSG